MKQRKSDILWKVVMEEVFDDFLRFIYPNADKVYDIRRGFHFLEKELAELHPDPGEETDTRFADKQRQSVCTGYARGENVPIGREDTGLGVINAKGVDCQQFVKQEVFAEETKGDLCFSEELCSI